MIPLRFFVDEFGYLWAGPLSRKGDPQYKRFEGVDMQTGKQLWCWERDILGDGTLPDWEEVTHDQADHIIALFRADARKRRQRE